MDRGAWWATVHGVVRVGYCLATKPTTITVDLQKEIESIALYLYLLICKDIH